MKVHPNRKHISEKEKTSELRLLYFSHFGNSLQAKNVKALFHNGRRSFTEQQTVNMDLNNFTCNKNKIMPYPVKKTVLKTK